jgi:hypothetical protein
MKLRMKHNLIVALLLFSIYGLLAENVTSNNLCLLSTETYYEDANIKIEIKYYEDEKGNPLMGVATLIGGELLSHLAEEACNYYTDNNPACNYVGLTLDILFNLRKGIIKSTKSIPKIKYSSKKPSYKKGKSLLGYRKSRDEAETDYSSLKKSDTMEVATEFKKLAIKTGTRIKTTTYYNGKKYTN